MRIIQKDKPRRSQRAHLRRVNWVARNINFGVAKKQKIVNYKTGIKAITPDRHFIATPCGIASFLV